eukprot:1631959-Lingulodinium_polyedra.AAC.1
MPSVARLAQSPGVEHADLHQCRYGARVSKPTRLLSWGLDLSGLRLRCNRPRPGWSGRTGPASR